MRIFFRLCLSLFFIGIFGIGNAQNIEISGMVIDAETNEPIPFANIALKELYKGTASNALGEFSFKVDSLPIVLVISHLSYEPFELEVINNEPFNIKLTPGKLLLDELVIKGKGNDEFAYNLVRRAYFKIVGKASGNNYGKAFYRQISKNGDEYSELYEMFYDTKFSNNGVDDWAIQEGRYALKLSTADSFIYNKNFTLMVRLLTIVQPLTDDLIMPVRKDVQEKYYLHTEKIMSVNNRKVAQIRFTKRDEDDSPVMEGDISIDVDSYEVLKLNGTIAHDKLKFISLKGKFGSWKNYKVTCEIAFKQLENDVLALDYMRLGQSFDYYVKDVFVNNVETKSFLTYYEYYTPPKRKKLGGRLLRFRQRDSDLLDNIGYNQLFWDENIIVKRTPIEAEVISSFEEERAFGSIYLNNKNQLILEDYELDNDPYIIHVKQQLNEFELPRKGEKVYIHHDKPFYSVGEKVWFKSYLVNMATNLPSDQSDVLHLDLISPEGALVFSKSYKIENGMGHGQFDIPNNLKAGVYTLNAYTNWMSNYDRKLHYREELEILDPKDVSGLYHRSLEDTVNTFFLHPEGGSLIEGLPVQVGFSAKSKFGDPLNVKGRLVNTERRTVSNIKSEFDGLGSFFMMPRSDVNFQTMIMSDEVKQNDFPEVKKAGYS
ncbi:MAG: carboxypeptidase-like regulatory domain-containing protein, partial [Cyclobacteriaceae bacterium]|nr:carboxypeptidase-like regulatory domain-containing protein [Cyclobacteriaceae bacterium]